jgi:hypothetical protein
MRVGAKQLVEQAVHELLDRPRRSTGAGHMTWRPVPAVARPGVTPIEFQARPRIVPTGLMTESNP